MKVKEVREVAVVLGREGEETEEILIVPGANQVTRSRGADWTTEEIALVTAITEAINNYARMATLWAQYGPEGPAAKTKK